MSKHREPPHCRATEDGYRVNDEHYDDCDNPRCLGCFPCAPKTDDGRPLEHCTARVRCANHVPPGVLTCPQCVGKVRWRLARIVDFTALLPAAAVASARLDSEAVNLAGPVPEVGDWVSAAARAALDGIPGPDDPDHPYLVLGRWELMLREEYGPPSDNLITVTSAVKYLDTQLDRLAQDRDQDFPEFVRDVTTCLFRLEAVMALARHREVGAPCPACRDAGEKKPPRLALRRSEKDKSGASDRWVCPTDTNHRWTDAEYRMRVGKDHIAFAARLPLAEMASRTRVPAGTLRRWASRRRWQMAGREAIDLPPLLDPVGRAEDGRKLYRVIDVEAIRDGVCTLEAHDDTAASG